MPTTKQDVKSHLSQMYDFVNHGKFNDSAQTWKNLKNHIVKFYGIKGADYETFKKCFADGDWYLSRVPIDLNKNRMQEILRKMSLLIKGKTDKFESGDKKTVLAYMKELYTDLLENYRIIFSRVAKMEYAKECRAYADVMGDELMELRDMEPAFAKLNDYNIYLKYNIVRRQIGQCESVLPRLVEAFRTAQVKSQFQREFGILFQGIEDLLSPVQMYDFASHEEEIIKLWSQGKTIPEIATSMTVDANALAVYMHSMDQKRLVKKS